LSAVAVKYGEFQELGVEVLSVSVDSVYSHKVWQEVELSKMVGGGVPYPMLSDPGGKIGDLYGVYDEGKGVDVRGRFLIDPEGVIQAMEVMTPPVGRNVAEVLRQLKAFQHHQKTGELMPSGWQPGRPTLPPETETLKMAGKVWEVWKPEMAF
jgi:peroxiredoxin (alkyl hydroperoxide reductase subunit C)